jgi:hypothetical protein
MDDQETARHHFALAYHLTTQEATELHPHDLLWDWGQFEYRCGHHDSGIALCRLALMTGIALCEYVTSDGTIPSTPYKDEDWQFVVTHSAQIEQMSSAL